MIASFPRPLLAAFALLALALTQNASAADPARPNIVFILADDLGMYELGCYGQKKIRTPSIDKLAQEGMRFIGTEDAVQIALKRLKRIAASR